MANQAPVPDGGPRLTTMEAYRDIAMREVHGRYDEASTEEPAKIGASLCIRLPVTSVSERGHAQPSMASTETLESRAAEIPGTHPSATLQGNADHNVVWVLSEKDAKISELKAQEAPYRRRADLEQRAYVIACNELHAIIAAKDARIAELDTELALLRATPKPEPQPGPNPFRDFQTDRRRIGG